MALLKQWADPTLSDSCCCRESRTSALANIFFYLGKQVDKKQRKHKVDHFQDLDISYALEMGAKLWSSSLQLNLFTKIGLVSEMYGPPTGDLTINRSKVTADDAIDCLSTGALLCSEACIALKNTSLEVTQDESMEDETQDEAQSV